MIGHEKLHEETVMAAKREKTSTLELLNFLLQVEDRRTFAVVGYDSMFTYVRDGLGYSSAQASERVAAMRLLRKVPEVADGLKDGSHTLTSVAKLASHVRRENLDRVAATSLVLETANQTTESLEKYLLGMAQVEPPKVERSKIISAELTRLTIDVEEEFMNLVKRVRELRGNPALPLSEVFRHAMKEEIRKREPKAPREMKAGQVKDDANETVAEDEVRLPESELKQSGGSGVEFQSLKRSRYISMRDRAKTHSRANGECEYFHPQTGKRCGSGFGLQMEHVVPFAKGGVNTAENLRAYCPAHNQLSAVVEYGTEKMQGFHRLKKSPTSVPIRARIAGGEA
ncbi:MAG: HNH endonuclease [Cryobacterium sp.]|nr:HNH endonuclease [Oligoflexia bacterium]